ARDLALRSVFADHLREDAVVVAYAVTRRGIAERCQGVEETSSETAEAAVAETRVFLLRCDLIEIVTERLQRLAYLLQQSVVERRKGVDEAAPEQELHRQVADAFHARTRDAVRGRDPTLRELFANRDRERVVKVATGRARHGFA